MLGKKIKSSEGRSAPAGELNTTSKPTKSVKFRALLVYFLVLFLTKLLGIYLFSRGFLLTRASLPNTSDPNKLPSYDVERYTSIISNIKGKAPESKLPLYELSKEDGPYSSAWYPEKFQRAILLVIDALRIDFATRDEGSNKDHPYHNKLPIIQSLVTEKEDQAMLYRARADPPTTTLQRLKGITTGQLPAFIDASTNFAGQEIKEDNWLQQLKTAGTYRHASSSQNKGGHKARPRNIFYAGDDTWVNVFPQILSEGKSNTSLKYNESGWGFFRPMPSLDVWDLHTVDDGVITRLPYFLLPPAEKLGNAGHMKSDLERISKAWEDWRSIVVQDKMWDHSDFDSTEKGGNNPLINGELKESWDLIIGHTLGVDHCGHRFGPNHGEMAIKLTQMNKLLTLIVDALDYEAERNGKADTVLYVMGDHGMDMMGDHGGESDHEVDAAMFIYSPKKGWNSSKGKRRVQKVIESASRLFLQDFYSGHIEHDLSLAWWENTYVEPKNEVRSISQIDLVSSISLTLGIPIPFNNLGTIIPEVVANDIVKLERPSNDGLEKTIVSEWGFLRAMRLCSHQLLSYIHTYISASKFHGFSQSDIHLWHQLFDDAEEIYMKYDRARIAKDKDVNDLEDSAALGYYVFMKVTLSSLRRAWAQFDLGLMILGILIMIMTTVFTIVFLSCSWKTIFPESISLKSIGKPRIAVSALLSLFTALGTLIVLPHFGSEASSIETVLGGSILGLQASILIFLVASIRKDALVQWFTSIFLASDHPFVKVAQTVTLISFFIPLIHSLFFTSNSFIFGEDGSSMYLTQTVLIALLCCSLAAPDPSSAQTIVGINTNARSRAIKCSTAMLIITRLSYYSTVCREEKGPECKPTFYGTSQLSTVTSIPLALINAATVIIAPLAIYIALKQSQSHVALVAKRWTGIVMPIVLALSFVYWLVDSITSSAESSTPGGSQETTGPVAKSEYMIVAKLVCARLAFALALGGGIFSWIFNPFCLEIKVRDSAPGQLESHHKANKIEKNKKTVIILGFGNAHGASYLLFLGAMFSVLFIAQQPMGEIMLTALLIQILLSLELFDSLRDCYQVASSQDQKLKISHEEVGYQKANFMLLPQTVLLVLFSYVYYFSTGHQFTLASIQWSSAFVGLRSVNLILSGILVFINSLGSFILVSLSLPLIVLWNRSLVDPLIRGNPSKLLSTFGRGVLMYIGYNSVLSTFSAICAGNFRRHLMVWKIFLPRFLFSVPILLIAVHAVILLAIGFAARRVINKGFQLGI
ncbi:mannose-ethanolamine phosphotransferase gpi13 [Mycoemilia scoparia]|uniref:Mannose-ethanolamine phosphotransferase gpi13 n=1 Tax=Mycoemilia scoparia TaxID=417184 RepID=A0A9W8A374_9FUNG|nr:mannose-ethanolamine phosphotransferase gpi13 [Mycoemilia scoparia]